MTNNKFNDVEYLQKALLLLIAMSTDIDYKDELFGASVGIANAIGVSNEQVWVNYRNIRPISENPVDGERGDQVFTCEALGVHRQPYDYGN